MPRYFALVPAAGNGSRMGQDLPKQYLELAGHPLLFHAVEPLARHPAIERVFVVLAPGDTRFARQDWRAFAGKLTPLYCGGATRSASVANGLLAASDTIQPPDWVLVHDAARPCLGAADLDRLIRQVGEDETGGLLAVPIVDTLKRADAEGLVLRTESRESLWQAQTPQLFRCHLLNAALHATPQPVATDEACAIEHLGLKPRLIVGSARNLKVTYPEDLELAQLILTTLAHERSRSNRPGV